MKKEKFANLKLEKIEVLSENQMKEVKGGGGYVLCPPGQTNGWSNMCWCSNVNNNTNPASCYQW